MRVLLRAGYDFSWRFVFKLDGIAEDLSAAVSIKAALKNEDKTIELIADTAQVNSGGASWATGLVVLRFPAAATVDLIAQTAYIEVAVVINSERLAYPDIPVDVELGYVLS